MVECKGNRILVLGGSALALLLTACSGNGGSSGSTATTTGASSLTGSYVFSVVGTDPNDGDYAAVGSFVTDGKGNVTSGIADYNLGSGVDSGVPLTGTYTVSGNTITVNLTDGLKTTDTFTSTLPTSGSSAISSFDGTGTGTLYTQVTTGFTPVGSYAFTVGGEAHSTVTGSGQVVVGPAYTFTGGTYFYQDGSSPMTYSAPAGFLYPPPTANGRGQGAIVGTNLSYYVIGPKQVEMIGLAPQALLLFPATKQ